MDRGETGNSHAGWTVTLAGAVVAAAGGMALAGWAPLEAAAGMAAAGGVVIAAGSWAAGRGRRAALARLERAVRGQLESPLGRMDRAGDGGFGALEVPGEIAALKIALAQLAGRAETEGKELAKKTRNLEAIIAAMDEPLLAIDDDRCVQLCNRSAEAIFDAGPGELVGRPIGEVFTHAELLAMHDAARAGEVRRGRVRLTTTLGKRVFQVSASPVPAAWGEGIYGAVMVLRDVTELDQAVQVKTDFVANASHELRTPVAAIRTAAETLKTALADDPAMAARVSQMIVNHAGRLEELLRDLLDLSRLESPDAALAVEPVALGEIARQMSGLFEEICRERRLTLSFDFEDELEGMRTDRKLLTLILRNLVENATKFAYEGTEVRVVGTLVEVHVRGPGSGAVAAGAAVGGAGGAGRGVVRLEVIDRGIGIPINQQDRVFERFYQVDPARTGGGGAGKRGTGLGLAIVKHAAKALGGRVGLKSVWGQGTTAWAELPVELGPAGAGAEAGVEARRAS